MENKGQVPVLKKENGAGYVAMSKGDEGAS